MFKKPTKLDGADKKSQEDLSSESELSGSTNNLSKSKESIDIFGRMFRRSAKPFEAKSQEDLSGGSELSGSTDDLSESHSKEKGTFVGGMFKKRGAKFQSQEALSVDDDDHVPTAQSVKAAADGIMKSMFYTETQVKSNPDGRGKGEMPAVPPRPTEEEMKRASTHNKVKPCKTEDKTNKNPETPKETAEPLELKPDQVQSNTTQQENRAKNLAPAVPPRPTEEEIRGASPNEDKPRTTKVEERNPREKKDDPVGTSVEGQSEVSKEEEFVQRESNWNDPESNKTENEVKEAAKVKPKKHNPFMPRVKAKVKQRNAEERAAENAAENEGANRSVFDQLEDLRVDPRPPETSEDVEDLMDWWNTVESWEETHQDDDMTEKEEAKVFAVTADKVQKGIRVFNKLFSERGESLWQHIMDLNAIADGLDKFNKKTKIAQITGGSTSAIGGVATITGLALAPVTMGTSLIVTAVGLGVATAGGLTSAGAGISNQVNNSMDRKKVEKIVEDYQEKIADFNKCLKFIKQGIDNLRKFSLLKMKNHSYNQDFPALTSSFYEDGAMAGKAILINANEIMRVVQIANVAGSTAARAVQVASMATGVLTGLFVGMDIYFVAKDSKILKKGAKSEFAAKIREVVEQLHDGLVELNTIRMELQSTQPESNTDDDDTPIKKMEEEKKYSSSDEDDIDQIKKQIKKDIENREYV